MIMGLSGYTLTLIRLDELGLLSHRQLLTVVNVAEDQAASPPTSDALAALGIGLAHTIHGRDPMIDGFGLIAFASLTPMIFVMGYGMLF